MTRAILVAGLGFGDEGKGSIVDSLVRTTGARWVVRYNGGHQAAHNVVTPGGAHHTFSQWGSGTLAGARTWLSRFMVIDPLAMIKEAEALERLGVADPFGRLVVDENCLVTTPYHWWMNRVREHARGEERHGSCGLGVGETVADGLTDPDALRVRDLTNGITVQRKLNRLRDEKQALAESLKTTGPRGWFSVGDTISSFVQVGKRLKLGRPVFSADEPLVFEGAQGVLLDEWHGFHPHTTWSTTTFTHAEVLLTELGWRGERLRLGVTRAYATRHGVGPFPTESASLCLPDAHNGSSGWQGAFRVGWLDVVLLRYAVDVCGRVDVLAVTCLDRLPRIAGAAVRYDNAWAQIPCRLDRDLVRQGRMGEVLRRARPVYRLVDSPVALVGLLETRLGVPIGIESWGPTADDKRYTRAWTAQKETVAV